MAAVRRRAQCSGCGERWFWSASRVLSRGEVVGAACCTLVRRRRVAAAESCAPPAPPPFVSPSVSQTTLRTPPVDAEGSLDSRVEAGSRRRRDPHRRRSAATRQLATGPFG
jgi:hypothetical protein